MDACFRNAAIGLIIFFGISSGWANEVYPPLFEAHRGQQSQLQLSTRELTEIRVKVFPHLRNYAPQGVDTRVDRTAIFSDSTCHLYSAKNNPPRKGRKLIRSSHRIDLDLSEVKSPRWVECEGPAWVDREAGKQSYSYLGSFYVHRVNGAVEVINIVDFATYLKGVVPIEMPTSWHAEALRAQAVAARTYAYYHVALARGPEETAPATFDVDDTVWYQAYTGTFHSNAATDEAVEATRGEILLHEGQVIQAYFSADSGGYTADARYVWGADLPYCRPKKELYTDADIDQDRWGPWKVELTLSELNRRLSEGKLIPRSPPIESIWVSHRTVSGRAEKVRTQLRGGRVYWIPGVDFRRVLGLRSTMIDVVRVTVDADPLYRVDGRGFGHGVGMSQLGAHTMASRLGHDYRSILGFYYTDVSLCNLNLETCSQTFSGSSSVPTRRTGTSPDFLIF